MKKNVAVIMGGYSSEHDISVLSGTTVFNHIDKTLYNAYKVIVDKNNWNLITKDGMNHSLSKDKFSCDVNGTEIKFDIIFFDPPFTKPFLYKLMINLHNHLKPHGLVYFESNNSYHGNEFKIFKSSRVGQVYFHLLIQN